MQYYSQAAFALLVIAVSSTASAQPLSADATETFEVQPHQATSFDGSGVALTSSGSIRVQDGVTLFGEGSTAGGGSSLRWIGTDYGVATTGEIGTLLSAPAGQGFRVVALDAWTSGDAGDFLLAGDITFTGTLASGGEQSETLSVTPSNNSGTGYDDVVFGPLSEVLLTSLRVSLPPTINYIALDNIELELRPTDPCASAPCANAGVCSSVEGDVLCACADGWEGARCEVASPVDPCDPNPCSNDGFCTAEGGEPACVCTEGFEGPTCEATAPAEGSTCATRRTGGGTPLSLWLVLGALILSVLRSRHAVEQRRARSLGAMNSGVS